MPRKKNGLVWRALLSLVVLAASGYLLLTTAPRLGLDLRGGTQIVLETTTAAADAEAVAVIGRTAQLSFHPVLADGTGRVLADEDGRPLTLGPAALRGDAVDTARANLNPNGAGWLVGVEFTDGAAWERLTAQAACHPPGDERRRLAIVLDDEVISSPQVDPSVSCGVGITGDSTQITGRFSQEQARDLALLISAGALPVPVEIVEQRTVGPTLGAAAIDASARAAVIGLALTALFLVSVYWLAGVIAVLALLCYAAVSYAALLAVGATLTLPGLAGFVLTIGMAVDATVLVFERTREERTRPPRALDRGYRGALSAIVDSNVTTLLAGGLLFWLASGPVRGFGVTLTIGVLAAMFTSLVLTRVLLRLAASTGMGRLSGLAHEGRVRRWVNRRDPGFLARPRRWLLGAGVAVGVALLGLVVVGPTLGVEFTGGRVLEYSSSTPADVDQVRTAVADAGFPRAVVQTSGDTIAVRVEPVGEQEADRIRTAVASVAGDATPVRDEKIGPSLGEELRTKATVALGLAVAAQLGYLAVRFDWRLGLATVVALVQDVLVVLGIFTWLGRTVDGVFLAALLTIIGYSVNDTVVVFDRLRELRRGNRRVPFATHVGQAVLQTLPRTVNTGIGVLFVLGALQFLGDGSLADFALALLLGLVAGTASTIVTAAPVAILLNRPGVDPGRSRSSVRRREEIP